MAASLFDSIITPSGELDQEKLRALMSSFGPSPEDRTAANKQAMMALGLGLLGGRKGYEGQAIAGAGLNALGVRNQSLADIQHGKQQSLQTVMGMAKLQQAMQQQKAAQELQQQVQGAFSQAPQLQNMAPGGPTPENAQRVAPLSQVEQYRKAAQIYMQAGQDEKAKRANDIANSLEEEYSTNPNNILTADGNVQQQLISKRGKTMTLPGTPAIPLHFGDTGSALVGLNTFTGAPGMAPIPKTMTPGETASNKLGWANYGLSAAANSRAAANVGSLEKDSNGNLYRVTGTNATPVTTGDKPFNAGAAKNAPEAYTSQLAGIENLSSALTDYRTKLKGWSNADLASPDKRAKISSSYTDALMQAKEAYRLGVLNGPDYTLLTSVLTDPVSVKGALVSNEGMDKQIEDLLKKMEQRKKNLAYVYKQPIGGGASGGWSAVEIK